jgi:hypothetical protein
MSRTYNTRPMWVRNNDPRNVPVRVSHQHSVVLSEVIGEEEYEPHWAPGTTRTRALYHRWSEPVECTVDVPEETPSSWRFRHPRNQTNEEKLAEKHCYCYPRWYSETWRSEKDFKRLTNSAVRGKVRQQLHTALISDLDWDEIDIHTDSKYDWSGWWD